MVQMLTAVYHAMYVSLKQEKCFGFCLYHYIMIFFGSSTAAETSFMHHHLLYMQYTHAVVIKEHYHLFSALFLS